MVDVYTVSQAGDELVNLRTRARMSLPGGGPVDPDPPTVPLVILDTDIAGDCDDVGAVAQLHGHANLGECQILATVVSSTCQYSPAALDAVNVWHGRGDIPVGSYKGTAPTTNVSQCAPTESRNFVEPIYDDPTKFPRNVGLASTVDDAVDVYREALSAAPDGSVTIVTIGFLTAFSALLDSPGDSIDSRNGIDLVAAKCVGAFVMGGRNGSDEYNVVSAPAASANVAENCPVTVTWNPWEVGSQVRTGKTNLEDSDHIVRFAYDIFLTTDPADGRQSWDLVTVLQAVRGNGDWFSTQRGTMSINPSTGSDTWTADSNGPHYYTSLATAASNVEDVIEPLMWHDQVSPYTTMQSSVTQHGITVNFDQAYPVGQFVNGDWFVVGEPEVVSTDPAWDGTHHGSMSDPVVNASNNNGFRAEDGSDFQMRPPYDPNKNLSTQFPYKLSHNETFLASRGKTNQERLDTSDPSGRPALWEIMPVTCLSSTPPEGSFRPPYIPGYTKALTLGDLDLTKIPRHSNVSPGFPSWESMEPRITRFQMEFVGSEPGRYIVPDEQQSNFSRDRMWARWRGVLKCLLDYPLEEKMNSIIGLVQMGIDFAAIAHDVVDRGVQFDHRGSGSAGWWGDMGGSQGQGSKLPVLFSYWLSEDSYFDDALNYQPSTNDTQNVRMWQDECQSFYVADRGCSSVADHMHPSWGYGERAWTLCNNTNEGIPGSQGSYRAVSIGANAYGVLAAQLMGVDWRWPASGDLADWYINEVSDAIGTNGHHRSDYLKTMWDTYRSSF